MFVCFFDNKTATVIPYKDRVHTQPVFHGDLRTLYLPLVGLGGEPEHRGLLSFGCGIEQGGDEAVGVDRVMVDELSQRVEPVIQRHVHLYTGEVENTGLVLNTVHSCEAEKILNRHANLIN